MKVFDYAYHHPVSFGLAISAIILFLILFLRSCGSQDVVLPPTTQQRIDSLHVTEKLAHAQSDSVRRGNIARISTRKIAVASAERLVGSADRAGAQADAFAILARRADSAVAASNRAESLWHDAYDRRTAESLALRAALDSGRSIVASQAASLAADSIEMARQNLRVDALEKLNKRITDDVVAINRCDLVRIVRFAIPCPTRKEAFAAGIGVTAASLVVYAAVKK